MNNIGEEMKKNKMKWLGSLALAATLSLGFSLPQNTEAANTYPTRTVSVIDFGAKPNDNALDTSAIQSAINDVSSKGGGIVEIPSGTYEVALNGGTAINMQSNVHLKMADDTVVKLRPNSLGVHRMFLISGGDENVRISGGTIIGDRNSHTGTTGEWGHGIHLYGATKNVEVYGTTIKDFWGDGLAIENAEYSIPDGFYIDRVTADNNRRQGLSIIAGRNIKVTNSVFKNTNGTDPAAGIDIEKDPPYDKAVENVEISNNLLEGNQGGGIEFAYSTSPTVIVKHNIIRNNQEIGVYFGRSENVTLEGNYIYNNGTNPNFNYNSGNGVWMNWSKNNKIIGNVIDGSHKNGIQGLNGIDGNIIEGNKITNSKGTAITTYGGYNMIIRNNHISGNANNSIVVSSGSATQSNNGSGTVYKEPAVTVGIINEETPPIEEPNPPVEEPTEPTPAPTNPEIEALKKQVEELKAENTQLKENVEKLETANDLLENQNGQLNSKVNAIKSAFNNFVQAMNNLLN